MVTSRDEPAPLQERWAIVRNQPIFYRAADPQPDGPTILHLHGFAISGSYMVPTARELSTTFGTYVPDLPGFGRSLPPDHPLTIPELADTLAAFLDAVEVDRATILGNSLGCAILASFADRHPDRIDRAILVSPAGGLHSRPLARAIWQLALDAPREPLSMATVAVPDYLHFGMVDALRLFIAMTRFPALETLVHLDLPILAVLGTRDPLLPPPSHIRKVIDHMQTDATVAVIKDAAHAINYSHPRELAAIVSQFMTDADVVGPIDMPDTAPVALLRPAGHS
jgi:pimeloyl-ACP methyl ester carboxylesterase